MDVVRASILVEHLQRLIATYGDKPVFLNNPESRVGEETILNTNDEVLFMNRVEGKHETLNYPDRFRIG